jgi:hypothetical protein
MEVSHAGCVNGVMLTSRTSFTNVSDALSTCVSYCQPVILPLKDLSLADGSSVQVSIEYEMGGGFDTLSYSAKMI